MHLGLESRPEQWPPKSKLNLRQASTLPPRRPRDKPAGVSEGLPEPELLITRGAGEGNRFPGSSQVLGFPAASPRKGPP